MDIWGFLTSKQNINKAKWQVHEPPKANKNHINPTADKGVAMVGMD